MLCVGVFVALDMLPSISKEEKAGSCMKKAGFCSQTSPTTFLHIGAVHTGIQLLFAYQITMEEGKKPILVGPCC